MEKMHKNFKYFALIFVAFVLSLTLGCGGYFVVSSAFPTSNEIEATDTPAVAATPSGNWLDDPSYRSSGLRGGGTSSNPYIISSAEDLAYLAYRCSKEDDATSFTNGNYFKLTANIDLGAHNWTPIQYFYGHFDGGNKCIKNLQINFDYTNNTNYAGLFGDAGVYDMPAEIHDLTIMDSEINFSKQDNSHLYFGFVAGHVLGSVYRITTKNNKMVVNTAQYGMYSERSHYIGGIVGCLALDRYNPQNIKVNDIYSDNEIGYQMLRKHVDYSTFIGGVFGVIYCNARDESISFKIENLYNKSLISLTCNQSNFGSGTYCVGGIIGSMNGVVGDLSGSRPHNFNFDDLINSGNIMYSGENISSGDIVIGGLMGRVGYEKGGSSNSDDQCYVTIENSQNNGKMGLLSLPGDGNYGGAVGRSAVEKLDLQSCINLADILNLSRGNNNNPGIGGLVGRAHKLYLTYCTNIGNIETKSEKVGGIVGHIYQEGKLTACVNYGVVQGNKFVGGIVGETGYSRPGGQHGWSTGYFWMSNLVNFGDVSATSIDYRGAIGGYYRGDSAEVAKTKSGTYYSVHTPNGSGGKLFGNDREENNNYYLSVVNTVDFFDAAFHESSSIWSNAYKDDFYSKYFYNSGSQDNTMAFYNRINANILHWNANAGRVFGTYCVPKSSFAGCITVMESDSSTTNNDETNKTSILDFNGKDRARIMPSSNSDNMEYRTEDEGSYYYIQRANYYYFKSMNIYEGTDHNKTDNFTFNLTSSMNINAIKIFLDQDDSNADLGFDNSSTFTTEINFSDVDSEGQRFGLFFGAPCYSKVYVRWEYESNIPKKPGGANEDEKDYDIGYKAEGYNDGEFYRLIVGCDIDFDKSIYKYNDGMKITVTPNFGYAVYGIYLSNNSDENIKDLVTKNNAQITKPDSLINSSAENKSVATQVDYGNVYLGVQTFTIKSYKLQEYIYVFLVPLDYDITVKGVDAIKNGDSTTTERIRSGGYRYDILDGETFTNDNMWLRRSLAAGSSSHTNSLNPIKYNLGTTLVAYVSTLETAPDNGILTNTNEDEYTAYKQLTAFDYLPVEQFNAIFDSNKVERENVTENNYQSFLSLNNPWMWNDEGWTNYSKVSVDSIIKQIEKFYPEGSEEVQAQDTYYIYLVPVENQFYATLKDYGNSATDENAYGENNGGTTTADWIDENQENGGYQIKRGDLKEMSLSTNAANGYYYDLSLMFANGMAVYTSDLFGENAKDVKNNLFQVNGVDFEENLTIKYQVDGQPRTETQNLITFKDLITFDQFMKNVYNTMESGAFIDANNGSNTSGIYDYLKNIIIANYYSIAHFDAGAEIETDGENSSAGGNANGVTDQVCGTEVSLTASVKPEHDFVGWFMAGVGSKTGLLSRNSTLTFDGYMPQVVVGGDNLLAYSMNDGELSRTSTPKAPSLTFKAVFVSYATGGVRPDQVKGIYQVSNAQNLVWISSQLANGNSLNGYVFYQTCDIDMSGVENFRPIGDETTAFEGIYDGKGFKISNLSLYGKVNDDLDYSNYLSNRGLFGATDGATIRNVTLVGGSVSGYANVGAIVGNAQKTTFSKVNNLSCNVDIEQITAVNYGYKINEVIEDGKVKDNDILKITSDRNNEQNGFGGVAGNSISSSFYACSNRAKVSATGLESAGLLGNADASSSIDQCYTTTGVIAKGGINFKQSDYADGSGNNIANSENWGKLNEKDVLKVFYWI